jgi:hypothetical protein
MQKNDKGQVMISSIKKLSSAERKKVFCSSIGIGSLVLLIYGLLIVLLDYVPNQNDDLWMLVFVGAANAFGFGAFFGFRLMISDLGYALPTRQQIWAHSLSQSHLFYSSDTQNHVYSHTDNSHMSINPSSGLPMSGSSGIDIAGNPFGTNSWRS